jgi:hypothetical protein
MTVMLATLPTPPHIGFQMHTGKAVAMSVAVLVAILLTAAAPTILKELTGDLNNKG